MLSCLAFVCWAAGTSSGTASLFSLDRTGAGVLLGLAVFLIPLLDEVLNRVLKR